jgi:hypothetical protein
MPAQFLKDGQLFTPSAEEMQAARRNASGPERRLIASLQSGETVANDPAGWIAELESEVERIEAGDLDGCFTIWQRMDLFLTGSCRPLLA